MNKRYSVKVEREVIIYAAGPKAAARKAIAWACSLESPAERAITVTGVVRLPAVQDEKHGPIIDNAPSRETRK
jgi:hypothetical protein